jgi:hypothetical protein
MCLPNIMFTVTAEDAAAYAGLFSVCPSMVTLRADDLLPALDWYLERDGARPQRRAYQRMQALREQLSAVVRAGGGDVAFVTDDDIRQLEHVLMLSGQFRSVHCPTCARDYARDELELLDWSYGRPLAARGGQRWVCPGGHTVCAHVRWFS